jgi:hypothetical protein
LREEVIGDKSFQVITVLVHQLMVLFGFLRRAVHENGHRNTHPLHGTDTQNKLIT